MTDRLSVTLLGGLRIALNGSPLDDFKSKKSPALLSYLIITGRPHSRDRLGGLLWGESNESRARANLRTVLWDLRQHLPDFVAADRQTVSFRGEATYWLDVAEFSHSVEGVLGFEGGRDEAEAVLTDDEAAALESGLSLYSGDFLAGFYVSDAPSFESWVLRKREWARQLAIHGWHRLVVHYATQNAYLKGIDAATQLLEIAPWQEETHRQLMRLLGLNGQRGAALAQYETCCEMLKEELGVEPTMETRLLYNRIKSGKRLELSEGGSAPVHSVHVAPDAPVPHTSEGSLVGRDQEVTRLKQILSSPDSQLASLVGRRGVGTTRLAWEVAEQMAEEFEEGAWFIRLPREDMLGQTLAVDDRAVSQNGEPSCTLDVLPELTLLLLRAFGVAFTGQGPLETQLTDYLCNKEILLVLDDLQDTWWSASELSSTVKSSSSLSLLAVSERPLDLEAVDTVRLEGLPRPESSAQRWNRQMGLEDLPGEGALALFVERVQRASPDLELSAYAMRHIARLCELTAGFPLAIELVTATLGDVPLDEGARRLERCAERDSGAKRNDAGCPPAVQAAVAYAWEFLGTDHKVALSKLALFGDAFDEDAAHEIAAVAPSDLRALAEKAWLTRLGAGQYLMHDAVRTFARSRLKKLAWSSDLWEDPADGTGARERYNAYYLGFVTKRESMLLGGGAKAACEEIEQRWRNVRAAWQRAVVDVQSDLLERSLPGLTAFLSLKGWLWEGEMLLDAASKSLSNERGRTSVGALLPVRLLMHRARLLNAQARWRTAADVAQTAVDRLGEGCDLTPAARTLKAALLIEWGRALHLQGRLRPATERLKQALALIGDDHSVRIKARAFHDLGVISRKGERYDEAQGYLAKALELYESLDHCPGRSHVLNDLGLVSIGLRQYRAAEARLREALSLAQMIGAGRVESTAYNNLGRLASAQGDHDRAMVHCQKALKIARHLGDQRGEGEALLELSLLLLHQGETQEAWKSSLLAVEIAQALGDTTNAARAWLVAGHVFSELDMLDEATRACELALELQHDLGQSNLAAESLACLARINLVEGDVSGAHSLVERVLEKLGTCALPGANEPLRVYLTCYQVLDAAEDPRAGEVLGTVLSLYEEAGEQTGLPHPSDTGLGVGGGNGGTGV